MRKFGVELEYWIPEEHYIILLKSLQKAAKVTGYSWKSCIHNRSGRGKLTAPWMLVYEDEGIEYNSPPLTSIVVLRKGLNVLVGQIHQLGLDYDFDPIDDYPECFGHHVHVDISDLKPNEVLHMVYLFTKVERYLYPLQPFLRENSGWCNPISDKFNRAFREYDPSKHLELTKTDLIETLCDLEMASKDSIISFNRYKGLGTVEVRLGASTTSIEDIVQWTSLCRRLISTLARYAKAGRSLNLPNERAFREFLSTPAIRAWAKKSRRA